MEVGSGGLNVDQREVLLVAKRAADWLHRLETAGTEERASFLRWARLSPLHVREVLLAKRCDALLSRADPARRVDVDALIGQASANVIAVSSGHAGQGPQPRTVHCNPGRLAAGFALSMLVLMLSFMLKVACFDRTIETEASDWQRLLLTDGTVVRVGPRTRLRLEFGDTQRYAYLDYGEAYFEIAKDLSRPFIVNAEPVKVRAVGTAFGVTRLDGRTVVTVAEGVVAITQDRHPGGISIPAAAGEQMAVSEFWPVSRQRVDVKEELAWVQGRLIFGSGDTVKHAIDEFNRRNLEQIELDDVELGARQVRGIFNAAEPVAFAEVIAHIAHARVSRHKRDILRIEVERESSVRVATEL